MQSRLASSATSQTLEQFPKRFLWGVATSAHQFEGGTRNQWSEWEDRNAKSLAAQAEYQYGDLESWEMIKSEAMSAKNYASLQAVDHYHRYEEDFRLAKNMGLGAWRFSIEWSRIEPEEGVWNAAEIEHYKRYVEAMKQAGLEPMMTLFHFTLPVWFAEKGGFTKRSNVSYFVRFAEKIVSELGIAVKYVITINEPQVYATESYLEGNWPPQLRSRLKWRRVVNNLAYAHKKTAIAIHRLNRRYKVSVAQNSSYVYAGDDAWLSQKSARVIQYLHDDYFLKKVVKYCDFLGVNYYGSDRFYGYRIHNPNLKVSDMGWDLAPEKRSDPSNLPSNAFTLSISSRSL